MSGVPILQRVGDEFDERNLWLQALLGLVSAGGRLEELLAAQAPRSPGSETAPAGTSKGEDAFVHFFLGLLACRERLHEVLAEAAEAPRGLAEEPVSSPAAGRTPRVAELLR